jgi:hypothetical protein
MARRAYSAQNAGGGFRPVQLSQAELQRMSDDSNRVINHMEKLRKIELQRGIDTLQAMKQNAAAEQQQRENNFRITQQNAQAKTLELQFERQKAEVEAQQGLRQSLAQSVASAPTPQQGLDLKDLLGGLANFSTAAGQVVQQFEVKAEKDRLFQEQLSFMGLSPEAQNDPLFKAMEDGLRIQGLKYSQSVGLAAGNQADPNSVARSLEANPANRYASKKSGANWMLMNKFESYLNNVLSDTNYQFDFNGQSVTFASARTNPRLMQAVQRFAFKKFVDENNLNLDPRFIKDGLNHVQKLFTANENRASQVEIKNSYARQEQTGFSILNNNPGAVNENIPTSFNIWQSIPTLGYEGALNNFQGLAAAQNPDGSFRFKIEDLMAADLKGTGKTFMQEFPGRASQMIAARDQAYIQHENRQHNLGAIGYKTRLKEVTTFLAQPGNNTQANIDSAVTALDSQYPEYGGAGANLRRMQASGSIEAQAKINLSKQLNAIPPDFLTIEDVYAAYQTDPTLGAEIDRRYQARKTFENSPNFKEVVKTFKTTANGLTAIGSTKENTMSSYRLQIGMLEQLRKKVAERVKNGEPPEAAVLVAGQEIEAEVKQGFRNQESPYYRKLDGPGGSATFPNLNIGVISQSQKSAREFQVIRQAVYDKGADAVASTPFALLTKQEGEQLLRTVGTPYWKTPAKIKAFTNLTKGGDIFTTINKALAANGQQTIPVPEAFRAVQQKADPQLMRILQKAPSVNTSTRVMGSVGMFNPALMPNQLGPVVQQMSQQTQLNPSAVAALVQVGGKNPNGVMPLFAEAMKTYSNPVNAAIFAMHQSGNFSPSQLVKKRQAFKRAFFAYGGGKEALEGTLRNASPVTTAVTGAGMTVEAFKDYKGRPVVLSKPALSSLQLLIQMSNGVVKPSDITSSQRSKAKNIEVGGSPTSYHLVGRALDISGESLKWMMSNLDLVKAAGFGQEAGYENEWHFVYGL